jgi:hypothetical protein
MKDEVLRRLRCHGWRIACEAKVSRTGSAGSRADSTSTGSVRSILRRRSYATSTTTSSNSISNASTHHQVPSPCLRRSHPGETWRRHRYFHNVFNDHTRLAPAPSCLTTNTPRRSCSSTWHQPTSPGPASSSNTSSPNRPYYRDWHVQKAVRAACLKNRFTRPYRPRINGKA